MLFNRFSVRTILPTGQYGGSEHVCTHHILTLPCDVLLGEERWEYGTKPCLIVVTKPVSLTLTLTLTLTLNVTGTNSNG